MKIFAVLLLSSVTAFSQAISYFNQGFLRQQNAAQDLAWLGISPSGSGSVTNFNAGNFSPLFTSTVTTPTTYPHLSFNPIGQAANLVYASPNGGVGFPSFRALTLADLPTLPTGGTVTNFSMGDLSPLFTTSVATPTFFPTVTLSLSTHANNTFLAGPNGGGPLAPTFRAIATGDLPDITSIVRGDVSASAPVLYDSATGIFSMHVADVSHDGYLSSGDWGTFNSKQSALTFGNLSDAGTDGITVGNGSGAVIGSGTTLSQHVSDTTHNGYLSSSDWNSFSGKGVGTVTTITNSGVPGANSSLVAVSNAPVLGIKSITAGANVSITDQNGTNLVVAASGIAGGSGATDLMQYMTNYLTTYRQAISDIADGTTFAGFNGFGDTLSLGFTGSAATAVDRQNFVGPVPLGPWVEMKVGASSNSTAFIGTQTFNTVAPYNNGGFFFQTYVFVRNTNTVKLTAGFASAYSTVVNTLDSTITNYAIFRYSTRSNDSTWHGVLCNRTNQTFVDTGATLIPDTGYLLQIYKTNGQANVVFVVNRTNIVTATSNAPNAVAVVNDLMGAYVGMCNLDTALKTNLYHFIGYTVDWVVK